MNAQKKASGGLSVVMGIFMILFGICLGAAGSYYAFQSWQLTSNGLEVDAVVVDLDQSPSDRTAAPIYEYTVDGETYRFRSKTKSYPHPLMGDHQTLLYDPNNPKHASENTFSELWFLPMIICPSSALLIIAAVVVMVVGRFFGNASRPRQTGFNV